MTVFRIVRLGIWSLIIALCVMIVGSYFAISHTFLQTDSLNRIVDQSNVAETVRSEILLPKVLQNTRGSDYSTLLDDKTVTDALNSTVTDERLNKKLEPAVESIQKWLNNKEPSIDFTINMSDLSSEFADRLSSSVDKKVAALPRCTVRNTIAQAETGVCRSSLITSEALAKKINEVIKSDGALDESTTITPDSITLSPSVQRVGDDIPAYLNMFYAASIVAAGVALFVTLWLLLKHRLAGIVAIGSGLVIAAAAIFVISIIGTQAIGTLSTEPQVQQVARAGATALEQALRQEALYLAIGGFLAVLLASITLIIWRKNHKSNQSVRFSSH